jgi:two-component system, NarL family, nitrate/nitrite sensor histidine kinase NarX
MKPTRIQSLIGLVFLAFAALVVISVGATYWGIKNQRTHAIIINQSGRQRMLVHYMTRLALEYDRSGDLTHLNSLQEAVSKFETTLLALSKGSQPQTFSELNQELPVASNPEIVAALEQVNNTWLQFKAELMEVMSYQPDDQRLSSAILSMQVLSYELIEHSELVVSLYEAESIARINRLYQVQFAFLGMAVLLLVFSWRLVHQKLIIHLQSLDTAAEQIGKGDLYTSVSISGPLEISLLGEAMESMRAQLLDSQSQLQDWGKTLEEKVAQRTRELEALSTVSREISSRLDITTVLQSITDKTCYLLSSEVAFLCLLDPDGGSLKLNAVSGPKEALSRISSQIAEGPICQLLEGEKALSCHTAGCRSFCRIMSPPFTTSQIAAPLRVGNRVIGALCVGSSKPNAFADEAAMLLMKLAYTAAVALENARLFEKAERTAALEERQRIAAEIHDGLAQTISTLQMTVDLARTQLEKGSLEKVEMTLQRGRTAIEQASLDIRQAIASLQEHFLISINFQDHMAELVTEFSGQKANLVWENRTYSPFILPHQLTEQLLRITREALLNSSNHSHAENIIVSLDASAEYGIIVVKDDGRGFDYQAALPGEGEDRKPGLHFGLKIMQARTARIGGRLEIQSSPGAGTCVTVEWPLVTVEQGGQDDEEKVEAYPSFYHR